MVSFISLHRGPSLAMAELIAVSTDPDLVAHVAGALLRTTGNTVSAGDPAIAAVARGRRGALRVVHREAAQQPSE